MAAKKYVWFFKVVCFDTTTQEGVWHTTRTKMETAKEDIAAAFAARIERVTMSVPTPDQTLNCKAYGEVET